MTRIGGVAASLLLAFTTAAHAYTLVTTDPNNGTPRRWSGASPSILFEINQDAAGPLPNLEAGSDAVAAIGRALQTWPAVSNIDFTSRMTSVESVGGDDVNLITLKDTTANRMAIEMAGGPLGLALVRSQGNNLVEADVVFNPQQFFSTLRNTDGDLVQGGFNDIEAVAAHELGHAIGLHHTGVESATMWSLAAVGQRTLDADDRAGARALYPIGPAGRIRGQVTIGPTPAFGAHVVALKDGRVAASALTLVNGNYVIDGLEPGNYLLYVEPLDGPHASVPDDPCLRIGNLAGAGIYNNAVLHTQFITTFFPSNETPTGVQVAAGAETVASFSPAQGNSALNPTLIGPAMISGGGVSFSVGGIATEVVRHQRQAIAVVGPGLDTLLAPNITFAGAEFGIVGSSLRHLSINCNGNDLPALVFEVDVPEFTLSGGLSLLLRRGGDVSTMTGAVDVRGIEPPTPTPIATATATQPLPTATQPLPTATQAPPTPTRTPGGVCVGDCDGNGTVTVDEIVTMVNIALGNVPVTECEAGDSDGSGTVTVDEILTAIQNALNGC
jgi:hypothetical protein